MLMSSTGMLRLPEPTDLDRHAAEFNFPVLDNANLALANARLTAFRSERHWCLFFELVGFAVLELEFVDWIYAYGSCIYPEGFRGERIVLSQVPEYPLQVPCTNECIADRSRFDVVIGQERLTFTPGDREYVEAGISMAQENGPGSITEAEILRFLVHKFPNRFFASDMELLSFAPACSGVTKFIQVNEWKHPDISGGEVPSQNRAMQTLIMALRVGDSTVFDAGSPNTHWRRWVAGFGAENQPG